MPIARFFSTRAEFTFSYPSPFVLIQIGKTEYLVCNDVQLRAFLNTAATPSPE
jgi:hypothetical protein